MPSRTSTTRRLLSPRLPAAKQGLLGVCYSRAAAFATKHGRLVQVELKTLAPEVLRGLYEQAIERYWDADALDRPAAREHRARSILVPNPPRRRGLGYFGLRQNISFCSHFLIIGAPGFEPGTSSPPD
jgi:hypothetical protein